MDLSHPHTAVCPTLDSGVLAVLSGTSRPLTGREVARLAGRRSHSGVLDVLNRLTQHGIVNRTEAGNALLYTLNREHLAAPAVEVLARMRATLWERLRDAFGDWEIAPLHASVFGSAARGDGDVHGDIDLFLVRPGGVGEQDTRWRMQRDDLAVRIERWTGNRAGIAETGEDELERLRKDEPPIVTNLRSDAVVVHGLPVADLLG